MDIDEIINKAANEFLEGNGKEAERLYLIAANQGSGHAAHNLGVLYITGAPGVSTDKEKALHWLNYSLESGFEETISTDPEWFKK